MQEKQEKEDGDGDQARPEESSPERNGLNLAREGPKQRMTGSKQKRKIKKNK